MAEVESIRNEKTSVITKMNDQAPSPTSSIQKQTDFSTPDTEKALPSAAHATAEDDGHEYVSGTKLNLILGGVTLVYFLVMLDSSIVATVHICFYLLGQRWLIKSESLMG